MVDLINVSTLLIGPYQHVPFPQVVKPAIDVVVPGSTVPPAQDPAPKVEAQRWNEGGAKEEEEPPEEIGDEADRELQLSLERARRLAQQQQQKQQLAGVTVRAAKEVIRVHALAPPSRSPST